MTIYSLDVLLFLFGTSLVGPCPVLTVASWSAYRFLKRQVRWSGIPISFRKEDNNRIEKTLRDRNRKDTKGTFHAKMGTISDRNGMGLTEAENIKKRWQESTEELYKKYLHDPDNHDVVITYVEPDILECKVKWALGSITMNKASGGDRIPVELFLILKDDAVKVLHSKCQQIWKTQQWPQEWKRSVFIPTPKKGNAKECSNYHTIALISTLVK